MDVNIFSCIHVCVLLRLSANRDRCSNDVQLTKCPSVVGQAVVTQTAEFKKQIKQLDLNWPLGGNDFPPLTKAKQ